MKSETIAIQQLFQDRRQYRVPFYQRAYVWNKEDQWERLWSDIQDKAEVRLVDSKPVPHFLGAAVLEPQQRRGLLGVETLHIIDGQQRLTTLQYVLAALAITLREKQLPALLSLVESCLRNSNTETMEKAEVEVFKLWPTYRDRNTFRLAMEAKSLDELRERFPASFAQGGGLKKKGIDHPPALEAIWLFNEWLAGWLGQEGDTNGPAPLLDVLLHLSLSLGTFDIPFDLLRAALTHVHKRQAFQMPVTNLWRVHSYPPEFLVVLASRFQDTEWRPNQSSFRGPLWVPLARPVVCGTGSTAHGWFPRSWADTSWNTWCVRRALPGVGMSTTPKSEPAREVSEAMSGNNTASSRSSAVCKTVRR